MSIIEPARSQGLVARAIAILSRPKAEWELISAEPATLPGLVLGYAAILAAVPALAQVVHGLVPFCFVLCITQNPILVISGAVAFYLLSLLSAFVVGLIIEALAPTFGAEANRVQAMKVSVYSATAAWLAGILVVIPFVGGKLAFLIGLYSCYLLYLGIERLMKPPADKTAIYTIVVVVLNVIVYLVVGAIVASITAVGMLTSGLGAVGSVTGPPAQLSGTVHFNGGSVDLGKLEAAGRQIEAQAKARRDGGAGKVVAIDPEKLKALLPGDVAGAPRTDVSSTSAGAAGFDASDAEATYQNGAARITLKVTDLAAAGGFVAIAGAMNVQSDHVTSNGYEKVSTINGRLTTEKYDTPSKSGEYSVIVSNRFSVEADGSGVDMGALKAAVAAVGPDRLEALAHG